MAVKNFNDVLKQREAEEKARLAAAHGGEADLKLDDARRVKVLSPGRLVFKRFIRNKLAIAGSVVLIAMFLFAYICPIFYPYTQTQIFYKFDDLVVDYASASRRIELTNYVVDESLTVPAGVKSMLNSYASQLEKAGDQLALEDGAYTLEKLGDSIYALYAGGSETVATFGGVHKMGTYNPVGKTFSDTSVSEGFLTALSAMRDSGSFTYEGVTYDVKRVSKVALDVYSDYTGVLRAAEGAQVDLDALSAALGAEPQDGQTIQLGDQTYRVSAAGEGEYRIGLVGGMELALISSNYVFDQYDKAENLSGGFKAAALMALCGDGSFTFEGKSYRIADEDGEILLRTGSGDEVALVSTFVVRRFNGADTLDIELKKAVQQLVSEMDRDGVKKSVFSFALPMLDQNGAAVLDENGQPEYEDTEITVTRKAENYVLNCKQTTYLIDIFSGPSLKHPLGTDGDGMDVLARAMYGGRVSLAVGFIVVLLECFLGVIMGGLAGYFGGWVDNLIMRLVDIFYCIPSYPILIIMGAFFDSMKMNSYVRLMWMMAILGVLGWAGVARMVRGLILSLREQEFMTATEATGLKVSRRIFTHLVPNVMPQLIVNATMGLGSVILYESTLSFLGLGVKHPLATWGTMINSVTGSSEDMKTYTYIWIPVGLLICLTVIAFNFVGDGLRDAFDPRMKQ